MAHLDRMRTRFDFRSASKTMPNLSFRSAIDRKCSMTTMKQKCLRRHLCFRYGLHRMADTSGVITSTFHRHQMVPAVTQVSSAQEGASTSTSVTRGALIRLWHSSLYSRKILAQLV